MIPLGFLKGATSPVQFIANSGKYVNGADGSAINVGISGSTQEGDFMMLIVNIDDATSTTSPSGWDYIYDRAFPPYSRTRIFSKTYTASDGSSVYMKPGFGQIIGSILTFRGVGSIENFTNISYDVNNTGTLVISGGTTTQDNVFVMYGFGHDAPRDDNNVATSWSNANISSAGEMVDITTSNHYDGGFACWGGYKLTAGATGNTTVSVHGSVQGVQNFGYFFYPT